jgi:hypothetical protein
MAFGVFGFAALLIPLATASWMLWVQTLGWASQWEHAPLAASSFFLYPYLKQIGVGLTASTSAMFVLVTGLIAAILYSWLWLIVLEDTVIAQPIEERWPDWLIDGLGGRDA